MFTKKILLYSKFIVSVCIFITLSGCWNSLELTDQVFVMGVSIDQTKEGIIELTTHMYSPSQTIGGQGGSADTSTTFQITTQDESLFEAIRDIPLHVGRKAQWSHMRVILVGEDFARNNPLTDILDFFYRDHELRFKTYVLVTQGKASEYWGIKPFIERTTAQQIRTIQESGTAFSSKTKETTILELALQLNYPVKTATVPYIELNKESVVTTGMAIVSDGKMLDRISTANVHNLLILTNEYNHGTIQFPCMNEPKSTKKDSLEVTEIETKLTPNFSSTPYTIQVATSVEGHIGEFHCSKMTSEEERKRLQAHIENSIKRQLTTFIDEIQNKKMDLIGIGNILYRKDPALWKSLEKDWSQVFSETQFEIDVTVNIESTGMLTGENLAEG
ncbi:Ger(x)C family spore germination protein [Halalkalibacter alkalisediminis]|uniref:Ger(X)C family spore germination protein n=1 Tax=Halalkalibacter alkalisediminis TaxID=935616 RepID=A0ABV6NKV8_9BACI|nr:Ger(x)C family spore germination protein [Halalkalibacter alkalisediminis]